MIKPLRAIPSDFAEKAKTMCRNQLVKHYRTSDKAVGRWADECGVHPLKVMMRPAPADWEQLCAKHTAAELRRLLKADIKVIKRWISETDIEPVPFDLKSIIPPSRKPNTLKQMGTPHKAIIRDKPRSIWDDAADVLRHYGPVYRCDERGRADQKGRYWRAGMVILTPDDLLSRADRYRRRAA